MAHIISTHEVVHAQSDDLSDLDDCNLDDLLDTTPYPRSRNPSDYPTIGPNKDANATRCGNDNNV